MEIYDVTGSYDPCAKSQPSYQRTASGSVERAGPLAGAQLDTVLVPAVFPAFFVGRAVLIQGATGDSSVLFCGILLCAAEHTGSDQLHLTSKY